MGTCMEVEEGVKDKLQVAIEGSVASRTRWRRSAPICNHLSTDVDQYVTSRRGTKDSIPTPANASQTGQRTIENHKPPGDRHPA